MVQDAASGLFAPTQARRQVIPYDDLQALNPPTTNPQISPDLLSTLSVGIGQGPLGPKLLQATTYGSGHVAAQVSFTAKITRAQALNDLVLQLDDPTFVRAGAWFWIIQLPAHGNQLSGPYFGFPSADPHVITLGSVLALAPQIGDIVFAVPQVNLIGANNLVNIALDQVVTFPGGTSSPDNQLSASVDPVGRQLLRTDATRPYDLLQFSTSINNAVATVTFAAQGAGKRIMLDAIWANSFANAVGQVDHVEVWLDALDTGSHIWDETLTPGIANTADRINLTGLKIVGNDNKSVSVRLSAAVAAVTHEVTAGAWILRQ